MITIEPYKSEYFNDTRMICYETSNSFKTEDKKLALWLLYHDYYCSFEPETCFVAKDSDKVCGYVFCAPNYMRYKEIYSKEFLKKLETIDTSYALFRKKELEACEKYSKKYPAHLHIDILPSYQGKGIGKKLLSQLDSKLNGLKIKGCFLITNPKNFNSHKLYYRSGYSAIENLGDGIAFAKASSQTKLDKLITHILNDVKIINKYKEVDKVNQINNTFSHGMQHILNVMNIIGDLTGKVKIPKELAFKLKAAAIFHDIGLASGRNKHENVGAKYAEKYLHELDINPSYVKEITDAIEVHDSIEFNIDCTKVNKLKILLNLVDKLDITHCRIIPEPMCDTDDYFYSNIRNINLKLKGNCFCVCFNYFDNDLAQELDYKKQAVVLELIKACKLFCKLYKFNLNFIA